MIGATFVLVSSLLNASPSIYAESASPHVGTGHFNVGTNGELGIDNGNFAFNLNVNGDYFITNDVTIGGGIGLNGSPGGFGFNLSLDGAYWFKVAPRIYVTPGVFVSVAPFFSGAGAAATFNIGGRVALPIFLTDWLDIEPAIQFGLNVPGPTGTFVLTWGMRWFF